MDKMIDRIKAVREAGHVRRAHNVPHNGEYTNASHSWGVACLCAILWPDEPSLLRYALFHDVPERWVGDVLASSKRIVPELNGHLEAAERTIMERLDLPWEGDMDEQAYRRLKSADRLELWLWCHDQIMLGNRSVQGILDTLEVMFKERPLEEPAASIHIHLRATGWSRHPEVIQL